MSSLQDTVSAGTTTYVEVERWSGGEAVADGGEGGDGVGRKRR
jgi:hypothetical protein